MPGLWRNQPETAEGKYLVKRRDGTTPEWPYFVLGARDPAAVPALEAYARAAEDLGMDSEYVQDILDMADQWRTFLLKAGPGDPDAPRHRKDDPEIVAQMKPGRSA